MSFKLTSEEMTDIAKIANKLVKTLFEVTQEIRDPEEQLIIMIAVQRILRNSLQINFDMLGQSAQGKKAIEVVEQYLEDNGVMKAIPFNNHENMN